MSGLYVYDITNGRKTSMRKLTNDGVFGDPIELPLYTYSSESHISESMLFMYGGRIYMLTIGFKHEFISIHDLSYPFACRILWYDCDTGRANREHIWNTDLISAIMVADEPIISNGKLFTHTKCNIICVDLASMDIAYKVPVSYDHDTYEVDGDELIIVRPQIDNLPVVHRSGVTYIITSADDRVRHTFILNREIYVYTTNGYWRVTNPRSIPAVLERVSYNLYEIAFMIPIGTGMRAIDRGLSIDQCVIVVREDDMTVYSINLPDGDNNHYRVIACDVA